MEGAKTESGMVNNPNFLKSALASVFTINFNHYLAIPLLGIFTTNSSSISTTVLIATLLSLKAISENSFLFVSSVTGTKWGPRVNFLIGATTRLFALLALSQSNTSEFLFVFAFLLGAGNAFCRPSIRALITNFTEGPTRIRQFQLLHIITNAGALLGPLCIVFFSREQSTSNTSILAVLAIIELLIAIAVSRYCNNQQLIKTPASPKFLLKEYLTTMRNIQSIKLYLTQFIFWFFLSISIFFLVSIDQINPQLESMRGVLMSSEGLAAIFFQWLLLTKLRHHTTKSSYLLLASISMGFGIIMLLTGGSIFWSLLSVALIGIGDATIGPFINTKAGDIGTVQLRSAIFGGLMFSEGIGEIAGYYAGAYFIELSKSSPNALAVFFTMIFACILIFNWTISPGKTDPRFPKKESAYG